MKPLLWLCLLVLLLCGPALPCVAASFLVDLYRKVLETDPRNHNLFNPCGATSARQSIAVGVGIGPDGGDAGDVGSILRVAHMVTGNANRFS